MRLICWGVRRCLQHLACQTMAKTVEPNRIGCQNKEPHKNPCRGFAGWETEQNKTNSEFVGMQVRTTLLIIQPNTILVSITKPGDLSWRMLKAKVQQLCKGVSKLWLRPETWAHLACQTMDKSVEPGKIHGQNKIPYKNACKTRNIAVNWGPIQMVSFF